MGELMFVYEDVILSDPRSLIGSVTNIDEDNQEYTIIIDIEYTKNSEDDLLRIVPFEQSGWKKI